MIVEVGLAVAVGVAAYEYFHNSSFKSEVTTAVQDVKNEYAAVKSKVVAGVKVVESDFTTLETEITNLVNKL
jgi:hypothetical protein